MIDKNGTISTLTPQPKCSGRIWAKAPKGRCSACSIGPGARSSCAPARTNRSSDFIALLEEVDRRSGPKLGAAITPIVLVLDNGPIHTSQMSRAALAQRAHWLTVEWLPK